MSSLAERLERLRAMEAQRLLAVLTVPPHCEWGEFRDPFGRLSR